MLFGGSLTVPSDVSQLGFNVLQKGRPNMAIGNAVQRGDFVYIYDEKGHATASVPAGGEPKDGLKGYTSSTVNVRRGDFIYSHDEHGRAIGSTPAH